MPLAIELKPVETLLYRSDVVAFGTFRCPSTHPLFRDSGPCTHNTVVFPRTSTIIRHRGGAAFTASPNCATLYNEKQEYTRAEVSRIDASDWFVVADDAPLPFRKTHVPVSASTYLRQRFLFERAHVILRREDAEGSGRGNEAPHPDPSAVYAAQDDMSVDEEAVLIVGEVTSHPESSPPSPAMREKVEEVKRLIALSPARTFALKYLAASTNCSPFHLCRAFRRETGMSITNFQHGLRLRLALDMLRSTSSGLSDIALQLGFASHSHFSSLFRRHFGITPSRFRARS